jgi:hypothetical protein
MSRFTEKDLIEEIGRINAEFEKAGHDTRFIVRPAYGRQYIYTQSIKSVESGSTAHGPTICSGTPSECSAVAWWRMHAILHDHYKELYEKTYSMLQQKAAEATRYKGMYEHLVNQQGECDV